MYPLFETYFDYNDKNVLCSYQIILFIIKHYNKDNDKYKNLTIQDLKNQLIKLYSTNNNGIGLINIAYHYNKNDSMRTYLENLIKLKFVDKVSDNKLIETEIENIINNDSYYITYIDIYLLVQYYNIPLIFISNSYINISSITSLTQYENFILANLNYTNNNYYILKIPSKSSRERIKTSKILHFDNTYLINVDLHLNNKNNLKNLILRKIQLYNDDPINDTIMAYSKIIQEKLIISKKVSKFSKL